MVHEHAELDDPHARGQHDAGPVGHRCGLRLGHHHGQRRHRDRRRRHRRAIRSSGPAARGPRRPIAAGLRLRRRGLRSDERRSARHVFDRERRRRLGSRSVGSGRLDQHRRYRERAVRERRRSRTAPGTARASSACTGAITNNGRRHRRHELGTVGAAGSRARQGRRLRLGHHRRHRVGGGAAGQRTPTARPCRRIPIPRTS